MKVATVVARLLLGLMFTVFGLNIFLQFIPMGEPPAPDSPPGKFFSVMAGSGYMYVVGALQVAGGLLLLSGYLVPLGLVLLAPVIVNIQLYHAFIGHDYNPVAGAVAVLEIFLIWRYWPYFAPLFTVQATPRAKP
jgi:putative oxidoreductase